MIKKKRDQKEYYKKYYLEHTGYYRKRYKKVAVINKEYFRKLSLKNLYNIEIEDYNNMFNNQEGKCAICGIHQTELKNKLCVDHNHFNGKVRGLLCRKCNCCLGFAKEDISVLLKAVDYLKNTNINY